MENTYNGFSPLRSAGYWWRELFMRRIVGRLDVMVSDVVGSRGRNSMVIL